MSDMEKNLNLSMLAYQSRDVMAILSWRDVFDPMQDGAEVTQTMDAITNHAKNFTGEAFGIAFGYGNIELVFTLQMTNVSTDGNMVHMTPMITHIKVSHYPFPRAGMDYPVIERLCNEAIQKYLVKNNV